MSAEELFKAGQLSQAVQEQLSVVKRNASDLNARFFLAELFCFQGDWERADKQLDVIVQHPDNATMRAQLLRQLVRGELCREQVMCEGRPPELVVALPPAVQEQLKLCMALRSQQTAEYPAILEAMAQAAQPSGGMCNTTPFSSIEDLDDRLRGVLEVMTANGKYFWVPWHAVNSVRFVPPERPMDLIWRKAAIDVAGGPKGESYVPVRYPQPKAWSEAHQLSRATDWEGDPASAVIGIGQRMLAVDDQFLAIMEIQSLSVASSENATDSADAAAAAEEFDPANAPTVDFDINLITKSSEQ